jgi:hypothetical protein
LFGCFVGITPLYDSLLSFMWVLSLLAFSHRPVAFPRRAAAGSPGSRAWSFYACLGSNDSAGLRHTRHYAHRIVVFRLG